MMTQKDLIQWLRSKGYRMIATRAGHYRVYNKDDKFVGFISCTPHQSNRSLPNTIAALRRNGVPIPHRR